MAISDDIVIKVVSFDDVSKTTKDGDGVIVVVSFTSFIEGAEDVVLRTCFECSGSAVMIVDVMFSFLGDNNDREETDISDTSDVMTVEFWLFGGETPPDDFGKASEEIGSMVLVEILDSVEEWINS